VTEKGSIRRLRGGGRRSGRILQKSSKKQSTARERDAPGWVGFRRPSETASEKPAGEGRSCKVDDVLGRNVGGRVRKRGREVPMRRDYSNYTRRTKLLIATQMLREATNGLKGLSICDKGSTSRGPGGGVSTRRKKTTEKIKTSQGVTG